MKPSLKAIRGLRTIVFGLAALALIAPATEAVAGSWSGDRVQGNGNIKKQTRELAHFTGLALSLPANVELRIGNSEGITIETDDNLLPLIETVIENNTLKIRPVKRTMSLDTRTMKIVLQAKSIDRIALGGSGSIESDPLKGGKLDFDLGGSGSINVKAIESDAVSVTIGGSGNLKSGGGAAGKLSVSIGGSGDVQLGQLKTNEASVRVAGSGEATVWARDSLSVTIAGSGDVNYYGDPKISKTVAGSGSAKRLGGAPR